MVTVRRSSQKRCYNSQRPLADHYFKCWVNYVINLALELFKNGFMLWFLQIFQKIFNFKGAPWGTLFNFSLFSFSKFISVTIKLMMFCLKIVVQPVKKMLNYRGIVWITHISTTVVHLAFEDIIFPCFSFHLTSLSCVNVKDM